jgi:hypothetical protein
MPMSQLVFFGIWLLAAMAAAVALYFGWQRLAVKYGPSGAPMRGTPPDDGA